MSIECYDRVIKLINTNTRGNKMCNEIYRIAEIAHSVSDDYIMELCHNLAIKYYGTDANEFSADTTMIVYNKVKKCFFENFA